MIVAVHAALSPLGHWECSIVFADRTHATGHGATMGDAYNRAFSGRREPIVLKVVNGGAR